MVPLLLLGMVLWMSQPSLKAFAQEQDFEGLMDDVAYPPPVQEGAGTAATTTSLPKLPSDPPPPPKRHWWSSREKQGRKGGPSEEAIVNVGPRETAPSPDLLFRLPLPTLSGETRLEPGFYLVKERAGTGAEGRSLLVFQKNKHLATIPVKSTATASGNGPVKPIDPKHPGPLLQTVEATVAEDQKSITLILREGDKRFQSDPLPTEVDTRPQLGF